MICASFTQRLAGSSLPPKGRYNPYSFEQQADQLLQRGLIARREEIIHRLQSVNYYRLSGYLFPFRLPDSDKFILGSSLEVIWSRYCFDRRLRVLTIDAIERIEIAVRITPAFGTGSSAIHRCCRSQTSFLSGMENTSCPTTAAASSVHLPSLAEIDFTHQQVARTSRSSLRRIPRYSEGGHGPDGKLGHPSALDFLTHRRWIDTNTKVRGNSWPPTPPKARPHPAGKIAKACDEWGMRVAHDHRSAEGVKLHHHKTLLIIAIFKWSKGVLLILLAFGLFKLLHHNVGALLESLANKLRVDPDNRYLGAALAKLDLLDDGKLEKLSGITLAYGVLLLTEGTGLYYEKRWAEILTVIATGCFIPLELYELFVAVSPVKCVLLVINVGVVIILIFTLLRQSTKRVLRGLRGLG